MTRGRKRTAPDNIDEWKLRAAKVKVLRVAQGFHTVVGLLRSDFWKPMTKVLGLGEPAYYKYENCTLCFQNGQLEEIAKLFKIEPDLLINRNISSDEFVEIIKWRSSFVHGSSYSLQTGIASTLSQKNGCNDGWFRGKTTVILGSGGIKGGKHEKTKARWNIRTDFCSREKLQKGYLFIGCVRKFGGLHSRNFGAQVDILLNESSIDNFSLMLMPEGHTDYFHRPTHPDLPRFGQIAECETKYTWTLRKCELLENIQTVTIVIDNETSWDIDYVGFLWVED